MEQHSHRKSAQFALVIAATAALYAHVAHAGLITSPPPTTDVIDWNQYGPSFTTIPSGSSFISTHGETGTVTYFNAGNTGNHTGEVLPNGFIGWTGNFGSSGYVNWTQNGGPLELSFKTPFSQVGAQIETNYTGDFTAEITAFDGSTSLGSYTENGDATQTLQDTAIFIGISEPTADITSVIFSITSCRGDCNDFAITQASLAGGSGVASVAEPGTLELLAVGIIGLGLARRSRRITPSRSLGELCKSR